jgi:hypothetical protein
MYPLYLYKDDPLQLIYVNSFHMQIGHVSNQSTHATSKPNQHSQGPIARFTLKPPSFN